MIEVGAVVGGVEFAASTNAAIASFFLAGLMDRRMTNTNDLGDGEVTKTVTVMRSLK